MSSNGSEVGEYVWLDTVGRAGGESRRQEAAPHRHMGGSQVAYCIRLARRVGLVGGESRRQEVAPRCHMGAVACRLALGIS